MTDILQMSNLNQDLDIKNTFIDLRKNRCTERRRKSLPPSFQPATFLTCIPARSECGSPDIFADSADDSTDIRTECSDESPSSDHLSSHGYDLASSCEPCLPSGITFCTSEAQLWNPCAMVPVWTEQPFTGPEAAQVWVQPAANIPGTPRNYQKLSSKAASFQPSVPAPKADVDKNGQVAEMLESAKALMLKPGQRIASVDVAQGDTTWTVVVAPDRNSQHSMDLVLASVQDALFSAAEKSNNVYVLGYGSSETAFTTKPQGFEAHVGVMDGTQKACWYMLKNGNCRRKECSKQHPALSVPVEIIIEKTKLGAIPQVVQSFKQEAGNIMMMLATMLTSAACGAGAQAFTADGEAWRIEIYVRDEDMVLKDHFLTLAKNAFKEAAQHSNFVHIMGTGATPFVTKSNGFSATLGEMQDQSKACWDVYMQGACWREQSCRWRHPQCLMPVNVILKTLNAT